MGYPKPFTTKDPDYGEIRWMFTQWAGDVRGNARDADEDAEDWVRNHPNDKCHVLVVKLRFLGGWRAAVYNQET